MEREFHRWLKQQSTLSSSSPIVQLGIGDDAAILRGIIEGASVPGIVMTTDGLAEGTHFDLARDSLTLVGRKMIAVNLSDLAAMGAAPIAAVINLNLPRSFSLGQAQEIFVGARNLANQFRTPIVGGDTNRWDGPLVVSATLLGIDLATARQRQPWLISGARPNDLILVSGSFGGSILSKHLNFEPRLELARYLVENYEIHAATDVSDSLSLDLTLMATASGEQLGRTEPFGFELLTDKIPISQDAVRLSIESKSSSLHHALTDGEDFELVLAVDPTEYRRMKNDDALNHGSMKLHHIGQFNEEPGCWLCSGENRESFEPRGYSH
jgi:thiamine-monophosphate kinase